MKQLCALLTAVLLAGLLSCAAFADLAPLPDDWWKDAGLEPPVTENPAGEEETVGEGPSGESAVTEAEEPEPEPGQPEPDPGSRTGCSRFSVSLFALCGGIVFIAGGVFGYTVARRRRKETVQ